MLIRSRAGFFSGPDLLAADKDGLSGNYGLYDCVAMLEWVRSRRAFAPHLANPRRRSNPTSQRSVETLLASLHSANQQERSSSLTSSSAGSSSSSAQSSRVVPQERWSALPPFSTAQLSLTTSAAPSARAHSLPRLLDHPQLSRPRRCDSSRAHQRPPYCLRRRAAQGAQRDVQVEWSELDA